MIEPRRSFLLVTLAEYQTRFWLAVAEQLQAADHAVHFLSYDDRSTDMCRAAGFKTEGPTREDREAGRSAALNDPVFAAFGIENPAWWLTHERVTYRIRDSGALAGKFAMALKVADRACRAVLDSPQPVVVQELGGFLSVLGAHFAARRHGIADWFIEPSFFRGRQFYLRSSLAAPRIVPDASAQVDEEVNRRLDEVVRTKAIVIPEKDRHFYRDPAAKVVNLRNARRLTEKLWDAHVLGKKHEFGHIGGYVERHLRMVRDARRLGSLYTAVADVGPFVYFPFHVPGDVALTLRSPAFLDQLALVEYLARCLPNGLRLAVKEHPAMVAALGYERLKDLLQRTDRVALLPPETNNHDVVAGCRFVVSVNSKSGAEALLHGKPVITLGDSFYSASGLVMQAEDIRQLPDILEMALLPGAAPDPVRTRQFFNAVWRSSYPGELYVTEPGSVRAFADGLLSAVSEPPFVMEC